jgi:hypothetical protein
MIDDGRKKQIEWSFKQFDDFMKENHKIATIKSQFYLLYNRINHIIGNRPDLHPLPPQIRDLVDERPMLKPAPNVPETKFRAFFARMLARIAGRADDSWNSIHEIYPMTSRLLKNVQKHDWVDVANYAMFLHLVESIEWRGDVNERPIQPVEKATEMPRPRDNVETTDLGNGKAGDLCKICGHPRSEHHGQAVPGCNHVVNGDDGKFCGCYEFKAKEDD